MASFPSEGPWELRKFVSSHFSNGLISRVRGILEARRNSDLVNHVTGDINYLILGLPPKSTILTIHDCGMIDRVTNPIKKLFLKWFWLDLPVRRAKIVTVDSRATRDDLIRLTGCGEEKIKVVPVCISSAFQASPKSFNQDRPRILHIGTAYNKNLNRHIEALANVHCQLHIVGQITSNQTDLLNKYSIDYVVESNLTEEEIVRSYRDCDLVLFASTLEGFGMPILEAQATGRAVVTGNISSMPEIAGDGACLVDPFDIDSIKAGVCRVIENEAYRDKIVQKGFDNLARFNPAAIAATYQSLYELVDSEAPVLNSSETRSNKKPIQTSST